MSDLQVPGDQVDHGRWRVAMTVNGADLDAWMLPHETLLEVLRDGLGHHEVRYGCGEGVCGTCTVLLDGEPVSSCLLLAVQADGCSVVTVRGLSGGAGGDGPHPLQASFLRNGAAQCGFCTPGMLLAAHALLEREARPSRERIRRELIGNLCRCTGYSSILDAIEQCAASAAGSGDGAAGSGDG
jgi:carbon-monoxide dehydrogenase small subunit